MQTRLLLEGNPLKYGELKKAIEELKAEEQSVSAQIKTKSNEFLRLIQNTALGQAVSVIGPAKQLPLPSSPASTSSAVSPSNLPRSPPITLKRHHFEENVHEPAPMVVDGDNLTSGIADQVCQLPVHSLSTLIATDDGVPEFPMKKTRKPPSCWSGTFMGVLDSLRDFSECHRSRKISCRTLSVQPPRPSNTFLFLVFGFALFLSWLSVAEAVTPSPSASSTLSVYALNTNGLVNPVKLQNVNSAIRSWSPHVFVIGETKTKSKLSTSLPSDDYHIFEEPGQQGESHHPVKWGIIIGVHRDIQVAQRVEVLQSSLKGRVIAMDIVVLTSDRRCYSHRFIGTYAPWKPGDDGPSRSYWKDMAHLCNTTSTTWTVAGDLNATVAEFEQRSGGNDARLQYLCFLLETKGHDLWSDYPDHSRLTNWTCKGHHSGPSTSPEGNIIDHVVMSQPFLTDAEIHIADRCDDWIPYTDHRAIVACISHSVSRPSHEDLTGDMTAFFRQVAHPPRVRLPLKTEKEKYNTFQTVVDDLVNKEGLDTIKILDDSSFLQVYTGLTKIITKTAGQIFGKTKHYVRQDARITNPAIRRIACDIHLIGGAIHFEKLNCLAQLSPRALAIYNHAAVDHTQSDRSLSLLQCLTLQRKMLSKALFAERSKEIIRRAKQEDRKRITNALKGGSMRKLIQTDEFIPFPLAVNDLDQPERLVCNPEGVKKTTQEYFRWLYDHSQTPDMPKPWLLSPSVTKVCQHVSSDPFIWPRKASLADFRAMLHRGNHRPTPGPDGWGKWTIKALSDKALSLVVDLHNYKVMNAHFPGDIKDMWLTMFHKRGLRTDLSNCRGLLLSNFLANSPMTWLNQCLICYSSEKRILPDTQVAAQPGVQTRDLMSFLSGVKC